MRSIHGVGELMSQVVLRGGGFLPIASTSSSTSRDTVKTQTEPEKQDILVMDTKLKIIEILQVNGKLALLVVQTSSHQKLSFSCAVVHLECAPGLQDLLFAVDLQEGV